MTLMIRRSNNTVRCYSSTNDVSVEYAVFAVPQLVVLLMQHTVCLVHQVRQLCLDRSEVSSHLVRLGRVLERLKVTLLEIRHVNVNYYYTSLTVRESHQNNNSLVLKD